MIVIPAKAGIDPSYLELSVLMQTIKLIVGLKNPGAEYALTRHNAGGWFVDALAEQWDLSLKTEKSLQTELAQQTLDGTICRVMQPLTYMNHSGRSVRAVCQFYRILPEEILVVHDELDLPVGKAKFKRGGGHGGHNGLRDIIAQLGTTDFYRLRIGIGHPGHRDDVHDYVLGKPSQANKQAIQDIIERAIIALPLALGGQMEQAMNKLCQP